MQANDVQAHSHRSRDNLHWEFLIVLADSFLLVCQGSDAHRCKKRVFTFLLFL